ncbi:hypothetical protein D3H65_20815 [Paraflavitalea soli]|uniref:Tetratricopeptide repeat protein n=1 Tax=Paraflavitalea soli TaxID=2315862 RepID=A0A3B7MSD3_9BACT|nr:hypothetical protein [Paraflavitalea soli]AXY76283.1 hypothetical protein D3H65_20815 [Paraflavitalea soli]
MKSSYVIGFVISALAITLVLEAFEKPAASPQKMGKGIAVFCAPSFDAAKLKEGKAPLIKGLGNLHYKITTRSKLAQRYFDQGLTLIYAFNHGEAARSFQEVIRLDSTAAMGWWGMAMVLGPNYNAALNPSSLEEINQAMEKARKYYLNATAKERALVTALAKRFPTEAVKDMTPYNTAYAAAMKEVYEQYPGDAEIAVLYADALMNEHPWNLYLKDGSAQPWTAAIEQQLEKTMAAYPNHPGAIHLYLHAVEASRTAQKAVPAARRLLNMLPAAGHLVHMPAHIYIRTGNYHEGVEATEKARLSDSNYINQCQSQGTYPLLYYPHNIHFLAACAFLEGNSKKAIEAAWGVSRNADRKYLALSGTVQHYYIIPYYVLVHLGKWDDILAIPAPGESLQYPRAIWHYARGMALAAKGRLPEARQALKTLQGYAADESLRSLLVWETNSSLDLITIAALTLEGELLSHEGQYNEAIVLLQRAAEMEDKLNYQEPPDWFFSVRHTLGDVLLQAKRYPEAEKVYREDLVNLPENGWGLMGLFNSLREQQRSTEAAAVKARFDKAWQWADITITGSRKY